MREISVLREPAHGNRKKPLELCSFVGEKGCTRTRLVGFILSVVAQQSREGGVVDGGDKPTREVPQTREAR